MIIVYRDRELIRMINNSLILHNENHNNQVISIRDLHNNDSHAASGHSCSPSSLVYLPTLVRYSRLLGFDLPIEPISEIFVPSSPPT